MENKKPIPSYPGYFADVYGQIWSNRRGKLKKLSPAFRSQMQYQHVLLYKNKIQRKFYVHELILKAFVGERPPKMICCHLDGNKYHNFPHNLAYGTHAENAQDRVKHSKKKRISKQQMQLF